MNKVALLSDKERAELFDESAARMGVHRAIIEKDFCVCWILRQLFSIREFEGWLTFKGGTSLSKCFHLIRRFSEDVDIAVDFERLGFTGDRDPRKGGLSRSRRQLILDEMKRKCHEYIAGPFIEKLHGHIASLLGPFGWRLDVIDDDPNSLEFAYPESGGVGLEYIRPRVVLELGTHAEPIPNRMCPIAPYASERFPDAFEESVSLVRAVVPERTFWEKATILHAEFHRPLDRPLPSRYSRHYSDVATMATDTVMQRVLERMDLLEDVRIHKDRFYHAGWARYMDARPGSLHLLPQPERIRELRIDYAQMRGMFFQEPPPFEDLLARLRILEARITHT